MGNAERKSLILAKIEATYGTDSTPVVATNAVLASKVDYSIGGRSLERDILLPTFGRLMPSNIGESIKLSFSVEARGSGTAATPVRYGPLLRSCGLTEAISTGVIYTPNSILDAESCSIYFFADGVKHIALGCIGNVKFSAKAGDYGKFTFDMQGLYGGTISDTAPGTPTYGDAATVPRFVSALFAFQTITLAIESLEFDLGNKIGMRKDANSTTGITRMFLNDRDVKGSFDPSVVALSTFNPWTKWDTSAVGAITAQVGATTGNKIVVSSPNCGLTDPPKYGAREGERIYQLGFGCFPTLSAGDNEISIAYS